MSDEEGEDEESEEEGGEPKLNISWGDIHDGIINNFFDQEYIERSVKRYDHKRGYCTLTATLEVTYEELKKAEPYLRGWEIEVEVESGMMKIEGQKNLKVISYFNIILVILKYSLQQLGVRAV